MIPMVVLSTSTTSIISLIFSLLVAMPTSLIMAQDTNVGTMCGDTNYFISGSQFGSNLNRLLNWSFPTDGGGDYIFSNATQGVDPDKVYGIFLCHPDVSPGVCRNCVANASVGIVKGCPLNKNAMIWYEECMVRYSNRSFFSIMETRPGMCMSNSQNGIQPEKFNETLSNMWDNLSSVATSDPSSRMYATGEVNISSSMKLDGLVQCTPDLSSMQCRNCVSYAASQIPICLGGKMGGRVLFPSCNIRYQLNSLLQDPPVPVQPPSATRTGKGSSGGGRKAKIIRVSLSLSAFLTVVLLGSCIYYQRRKKRTEKEEEEKRQELQLLDLARGRFGDDYNSGSLLGDNHAKLQDFPSIQLDLILAATKHFSEENKLGEGGFGPVYKGTLPDGKEIAVKRLSRTSGQGLQEFKNEVTLIARLQHRNLVRLLCYCLEGNELMLIYEYMPNKSLDVFLFDSTKGAQLDWKRRVLIIHGIARGLLYLHEDSRLRIIHRDLKASNVLLDHDMNPKISDFGMARIFGGNQQKANTNRVVGTYGYMAPEYAMQGLFSVKSDVFSFGVLLLEIISGKRNGGFYLSEHGHSLLTFAWKFWSEGQGLEIIDPLLKQSCVAIEVLKCIHIGLLCVQEDPADRPTMSSVGVMLGSDAVTLPQPTQPAFSVGRQVQKSSQSSNVEVLSVNEVTVSDVLPR